MFHPVVTVPRAAASRESAESMVAILLGRRRRGPRATASWQGWWPGPWPTCTPAVDDFPAMTALMRQCHLRRLDGADPAAALRRLDEHLGLPALDRPPTASSSWARAATTIPAAPRATTPCRGAGPSTPAEAWACCAIPSGTMLRRREPAGLPGRRHPRPIWTSAPPCTRQGQPALDGASPHPPRPTSACAATPPTARRSARSASSACSPPSAYEEPGAPMPVVRQGSTTCWTAPENLNSTQREQATCATTSRPIRRDELFQIDEAELLRAAHGHPAPVRPPQDAAVRAAGPVRPLRLGLALRARATATNRRHPAAGPPGEIESARALGGEVSAAYPSWSTERPGPRPRTSSRLAARGVPGPTFRALEAELRRGRCTAGPTVSKPALRAGGAEPGRGGRRLWPATVDGFPAGYRELLRRRGGTGRRRRASRRLGEGGRCGCRAYRTAADSLRPPALRCQAHVPAPRGRPSSDILPILDHMGLEGARWRRRLPHVRGSRDLARTAGSTTICSRTRPASLIFTLD